MLDKLKKYKYVLLLLVVLFILFLSGQAVNADSSSIEYNETTINVSYFNSYQNAFLMYDNNSNTYLSFGLFRTSNGEGSNPRFYIVNEDENYIYISGRSNQYFYNCTAVCNYNISTGTTGSVVSSVNYGGGTTGSNSNNASYKIDKNRYSFVYKGDNTKIYTDETCSVENTESSFFFGSLKPKYEITLSTNDTTYDPIYAYSNYFDIDDVSRYECYISDDNVNYQKMHIETMNYLDGTAKIRFYWKIYFSGTYYFKFVDKEDDNKETYVTFEVTNILKNSSNSGYNIKGIPQPFVTFSRVNEEFLLQTQSFDENSFNNLECYYTTDVNADKSTWNKMHLGTLNNVQLGTTEYYFYFTVPKDSQDTTYYFVFYDTVQKDYGYISSLECIFDNMNDYADKVGNVTEEKKSKLQELLDFFKERFGFLSYPFEFIINLLQRVLNINYVEPVLHFPQITNPLDDTVIFEGFDYNLKSILEFEGISYFYNIYLIAVDALLIFAFIKGCIKTFEEVSSNG